MNRIQPVALGAGAALLAMGAVAFAQTYPQAPNQSRSVAGWTVEDLAEPGEWDPDRRVIRMTRQVADTILSYEVYPYSDAGAGGFDARTGAGCLTFHGLDVEAEGEARMPAVRTALGSALQEHEELCREADGRTPELLEGFEPAYAQLAEWRAFRVAEYEEADRAYQLQNAAEMDALYGPCPDTGC